MARTGPAPGRRPGSENRTRHFIAEQLLPRYLLPSPAGRGYKMVSRLRLIFPSEVQPTREVPLMTNSPPPVAARPAVAVPPNPRRHRLVAFGLLAVVAGAGGLAVANAKSLFGHESPDHPRPDTTAAVSVEVVTPRAGGIDRVC